MLSSRRVACLAGTLFAATSVFRPTHARAVEIDVTAREVVVRSAPADVAPEVARVHTGDILSGSDQVSGAWRFVNLPDGRGGYVRDADVQSGAAPRATGPPALQAPVQPVPSPPDRGRFAALWAVPFATHHLQGAGLEAGYRYRWIVGLYRIGFVQNGYEPISGSPLLALQRTQMLFLDLEVDARWQFSKGVTLAVGGGAGVIDDRVDITSMSGLTWTAVTDNRWSVRPLVAVTLAGPIFQATVTAYVGSDPQGCFLLGVRWGRR